MTPAGVLGGHDLGFQELLVQRHRLFARVIRFDVASVIGRGRNGRVELITDAFDAGM